ncbi:MAG TPA: DUF4342 domain-containing protein [Acidimicrobiia bacterium]|jgi:hypothetical protein|nr:DUF4342 domain-containing protein [Acidimicrobiia bacterium]
MTAESPGQPEPSVYEDLKVEGEQLLAKVKELIHKGNVRRVIIKNEDGETLLEIPLTLGVAGALLAPSLVAVGAIAAMVTACTITIERLPDKSEQS